jgi:hypothetical protein
MAEVDRREWAHFVVRYQDGRSSRIRIAPFVLKAFNHAVLTIARDRQARGELPPGVIASVEQVLQGNRDRS